MGKTTTGLGRVKPLGSVPVSHVEGMGVQSGLSQVQGSSLHIGLQMSHVSTVQGCNPLLPLLPFSPLLSMLLHDNTNKAMTNKKNINLTYFML